MARAEEPFQALVRIVLNERKVAAKAVLQGSWTGAEDAKEMIGRYKAMEWLLAEMETIAGPGTHFAEIDV